MTADSFYRPDEPHERGRVVICLDNRLLAESLATVLARRGWTVEAISTTEAAALRQVALYSPEICIVGAKPAHACGLGLAATIAQAAPQTKAVAFGAVVDREIRARARAAGVAAVISEHLPVSAVCDVLDRVAAGEVVTDCLAVVPALPRRPRPSHPDISRVAALSSREREALALVADGRPTDDIALAMGVCPATVRSHIQSAFTKLGVHSRLRAVAVYRAETSASAVRAG